MAHLERSLIVTLLLVCIGFQMIMSDNENVENHAIQTRVDIESFGNFVVSLICLFPFLALYIPTMCAEKA